MFIYFLLTKPKNYLNKNTIAKPPRPNNFFFSYYFESYRFVFIDFSTTVLTGYMSHWIYTEKYGSKHFIMNSEFFVVTYSKYLVVNWFDTWGYYGFEWFCLALQFVLCLFVFYVTCLVLWCECIWRFVVLFIEQIVFVSNLWHTDFHVKLKFLHYFSQVFMQVIDPVIDFLRFHDLIVL